MGQSERDVFGAREWAVDPVMRELRVNDIAVPIGSRAFEIVRTLVNSNGQFVTKEDLVKSAWPGVIVVEDVTLRVHISAIRKALGTDRGMLETVPGRGYRLRGNWTIGPSRAPARQDLRERVGTAPNAFISALQH